MAKNDEKYEKKVISPWGIFSVKALQRAKFKQKGSRETILLFQNAQKIGSLSPRGRRSKGNLKRCVRPGIVTLPTIELSPNQSMTMSTAPRFTNHTKSWRTKNQDLLLT